MNFKFDPAQSRRLVFSLFQQRAAFPAETHSIITQLTEGQDTLVVLEAASKNAALSKEFIQAWMDSANKNGTLPVEEIRKGQVVMTLQREHGGQEGFVPAEFAFDQLLRLFGSQLKWETPSHTRLVTASEFMLTVTRHTGRTFTYSIRTNPGTLIPFLECYFFYLIFTYSADEAQKFLEEIEGVIPQTAIETWRDVTSKQTAAFLETRKGSATGTVRHILLRMLGRRLGAVDKDRDISSHLKPFFGQPVEWAQQVLTLMIFNHAPVGWVEDGLRNNVFVPHALQNWYQP